MSKRIQGVTSSDLETLSYALQLLRRKGWYPLAASSSAYRGEANYFIHLPAPPYEYKSIGGSSEQLFAQIAALPQKDA